MMKQILLYLCLAMGLYAAPAWAQNTLEYQGQLTNADGTPVEGRWW